MVVPRKEVRRRLVAAKVKSHHAVKLNYILHPDSHGVVRRPRRRRVRHSAGSVPTTRTPNRGAGPSAAAARSEPPPGTLRCSPLAAGVVGHDRRIRTRSVPTVRSELPWLAGEGPIGAPRSDGNVPRWARRAAAPRARCVCTGRPRFPRLYLRVQAVSRRGPQGELGLDTGGTQWPREPRPRRLCHGYDLCTTPAPGILARSTFQGAGLGRGGSSTVGAPLAPRVPLQIPSTRTGGGYDHGNALRASSLARQRGSTPPALGTHCQGPIAWGRRRPSFPRLRLFHRPRCRHRRRYVEPSGAPRRARNRK